MRKIWSVAPLVGLCSLFPFLFGQGCAPPGPESSTQRAHRICEPLYSPDYVDSMIRVGREDMEIRGISYEVERYSAHEGCDSGCAEHYYGAYAECVQICYPCADLLVDISYAKVPAKSINDPDPSDDPQLSEWMSEGMKDIESEEMIE